MAVMLLLACVAIEWRSRALLDARLPVEPIAIDFSQGDHERGRHVGEAITQCTFCHGGDWGGRKVADDAFVGRLYTANLTSGEGGLPADYADEDIARAVRHARGPRGRNLWLMPSEYHAALSDRDLADLIAYIRTLAPVDRPAPARHAGPLTKLVVALGFAPDLTVREPLPKPHAPDGNAHPPSGDYLVHVGICGTCHRPDLRGGRHPLAPPHEPVPPDISGTGAVANWNEAEFIRTMRTGVTPEGRTIDPVYMPWPGYARMSDGELAAVYHYLTGADEAPTAPLDVAAAGSVGVSRGR